MRNREEVDSPGSGLRRCRRLVACGTGALEASDSFIQRGDEVLVVLLARASRDLRLMVRWSGEEAMHVVGFGC